MNIPILTTVNIKREPDGVVQSDDEFEQSNQSLNTTENLQIQNNVELRAQIDAANQKIVELTSQLDAMTNEKDQQYKHFDHQLRKMRDEAEESENNYMSALKQIEDLKKRIWDSKNLNVPKAKRPKRSSLASSENHYYVVESLLNHKKKNGHMYYLIHWKNYDSTNDTWERESNLKCTALLKRYKTENNLS